MKKVIDKIIKKKQHNSSQVNSSSIKFKRKKTKANIVSGSKFIIFFILAGVSGAIFSSVITNIKYKDVIYSQKIIERNNNNKIGDYRKIINKISQSLVTVSNEKSNLKEDIYNEANTTGIILDKAGNILTSYSKVKGKEYLYVKLSSKEIMPIRARIIVGDENMDVAIIKIDYDGELKPIEIAKSNSIEEGQEIVILSNPICDQYIGNVVSGMITSTKAYAKYVNGEYGLIETNAPINSSNEGGAICNSRGELIAIAAPKVSRDKSMSGLYYGIKIGELENIVSSTNIFKHVLGIIGGGITKEDDDVNGYYIENTIKGGNAYNAGVKPTDIILKIDGKAINSTDDIYDIIQGKKSGDILICEIKRNNEIKNIDVILN